MTKNDLYERIVNILTKHGLKRSEAMWLISNRKNCTNAELVKAMGNQKAVDVFNTLCSKIRN